jgi:hypothetical protein
MGYKHGWKKKPLKKEDNQAPQPRISIKNHRWSKYKVELWAKNME